MNNPFPAYAKTGLLAKAGILAAALLLPALPASATPYSDIVVFGDSLVDAGNISLVSPGTPPAGLGYYNGRFSNGRFIPTCCIRPATAPT